jgi:hypothetical protein
MAEIIGDTSHLTQTRVPFNAVHRVSGASRSGHFSLVECAGVASLIRSRAQVRIASESLRCQVVGPAAADQATVLHVAIVPSTCNSWPSSDTDILTIGGSAFCQHSLFVAPAAVPLSFSPEVAHQIKPAPLVGSAPEVVYQLTIVGGAEGSRAHIKISGELEVSGIGFIATW